MKMRTLDEIRTAGLKALRDNLGQAGMIRFLSRFENGSGDSVREHQQWADRTSMDDIRKLAADHEAEGPESGS